MINTSTVQKLIEDNKIGAIGKAIEDSAEYYKMQSFNQALLGLIARNAVTVEEALSYSPNPNDLRIRLQTEGIVGTSSAGPTPPGPAGGGRTSMISLERLAALPSFQSLPVDLRRKLAKRLREESFAAGQTVFSEGDAGDALYFLAEGRVAIQKVLNREQGLFKTLSVMGPGDFFGEMSLLEKTPRWASAVTLAPTVLLSLSAKELGAWLSADAPVPLRLVLPFVESLNARLRQTSREMILFFDVGSVLSLNLESSVFWRGD